MSLTVASPTQASHQSAEAESASPATLAFLFQRSLMQEYAYARQQYRQAHAQYSARVRFIGPSRFDQYCASAFHDMFFYTSAIDPSMCCAASKCTHGPQKAGLHELNYQLRLRARERLRAAVAVAATAPPSRSCIGDDVFELLVRQEAAELADVLELEAEAFRRLAHAYYDHMYGPANRIIAEEARARRQLSDAHSEATVALLKEIREETLRAEQRLMLRAYAMCPALLPHHLLQQRAAEDAAEAEQQKLNAAGELDSKDAVPLWQRTCAIRGETESEEDISFRRLVFACLVQAHAIEEGYLARDSATGCLRRTGKTVPAYMRDAVEYGLQFEQFALVLSEETERMALADAAEAALATQCPS
jgi:hypothetical protein